MTTFKLKRNRFKSFKTGNYQTTIRFYKNTSTGENNFIELKKIANEIDSTPTEMINEIIEQLTDKKYKLKSNSI